MTFTAATNSADAKTIEFNVPPGSILVDNAVLSVSPNGGTDFANADATMNLSLGRLSIVHNATFTLNNAGATTIEIDGLILGGGPYGATGEATELDLTTSDSGSVPIDGPTDAGAGITIDAAAGGADIAVPAGVSNPVDYINASTVGAVSLDASQTAAFANAATIYGVIIDSANNAVHGTTTGNGVNSSETITGINASGLTDGPVFLVTFVQASAGNFSDPTLVGGEPGPTKDVARPTVVQVELSHDGDGNGSWDAIDDVLTVTFLEPVTLAVSIADNGGIEQSEEAGLEALLDTLVDLSSGPTIVVGDSGTAVWTLRVTVANLAEGVDIDDDANGTSNADVTDDAGNSQVAGSLVTVMGGSWVECGDTIAGVTVNSNCIVADTFQTSDDGGSIWTPVDPTNGNLDLDVFLAAGLLQVQVVDNAKVDQYELVSGGPLSLTTQVRMTLNLGDFDPVFLIGTGDLDSYATTTPDGSDNTATITARPSNASYTWAVDCFVGSCGNDSTQATVDYVGNLTFAIDSLANYGLPANFVEASRGGWVMTDAQSFGTPSWDPVAESFDIDVAAPHLMQSGGLNTGEFKAFIPDAMFGPDFFDISPSDAVFTATAAGSSVTATAAIVSGGVEVEVSGYGYSSPEIAIKASAAAPSGGGGGGSGGGTTTIGGTTSGTVTSGGTLSSATDATSDKPTKASVTSPVAGSVSITPKQSTTTELASGQTLLNLEVDIEAPAATPEEPLVLDFELDSSVLEDVDLDRLVVYRTGKPVPSCTDAAAAVPDPCLAASESQGDGDLVLTVRTSQASTWNFATIDTSCPSGLVPAAAFADVATGSTHAGSIDCAAWWGLMKGSTETSYSPADAVSRGQVASVLRSLLEAAGADLPPAGNRFGDDDPTHGEAAEVLAAAGVLNGTSATSFSPGGTVSRGQLASMLVGAYEYLDGSIPVTDADPFADDDTSVHADAIAKAAAAGFVNGLTAETYDPDGNVTREQLATFVTNVLARLVDDDLADPPV